MKEGKVAARRELILNTVSSKAARSVITQLAYLVGGFILSGGAVFGNYAPFGTAFIAAVPFKNLLASLVGTTFGYIILMPNSSFRYIATLLAIAAIRWTLSDIKRINKSVVYPPLLAFLPMLATGLVLVFVGGVEPSLIAMCIIEALLAGVGAFFFYKTIVIVRSTRGIATLNQQEIACMVMTGCILLLAVSGISFGGISLGRVAAVLIILLCARYGAVAGGCISGVSTGVIFSMSNGSVGFLAGAYAFGGLMAGLFAPIGKIATVISFLICHTIMSFQAGNPDLLIASIYETLIASAVFMLLPKDLGNQISQIFSPPIDQTRSEGLRRNIIMRLDFAANALQDVSASVDNVAKKMKEIYSYDISSVYAQAAEKTCAHCGLRAYCWENQKEQSYNDFNALTEVLKKKGKMEEGDFTATFAKKCCKTKEMVNSINQHYDSYNAYLSAERRVGEIRSVVAGQFSGLSEILGEMAEEFEQYQRFDMAAAERVSSVMKMSGLIPIDVSCRLDRLGRMTVEIETADTDRNALKRGKLTKEISKACGRYMDAPCISHAANRCRLQMSERPLYDIQIGSAQHVSGNGQLCGDSYNYFSDGMGRIVALISDGMGTGGRAAVDGSMAESIMTKLVKAGLGFDCALQVVNSALLVKSGDESLATLDVVSIDLFTGMVDVMKAGAPFTLIKKGDEVERVDFSSLPIGILTDVKFSHKTAKLVEGDWIIMVSDGAVATGDQWIETMVKEWKKGSAPDLSKAIVKEARNRRTDGYDDDITAIALCVMNNIRSAS